MNLTDHIINVALLGTATRELITTDFPEELQETLRDIQAKAEDAEAVGTAGCAIDPSVPPSRARSAADR